MRCVIQRSGKARVVADGFETGAIDRGLVVLVAFAATDTDQELDWVARKLPSLRIFDDAEGKMNLSLREVGGGILLVSQFTLYGDCSRGHRPGFTGAAPPDIALNLYERFAARLHREWPSVAEGEFGATMEVSLVNVGPVTLIIEREAGAVADGGS